jgi:20S proteasome alpha/beta subunit
MNKLIGEVQDPVKAGPYGVVNAGTSVFACKYKDGIMFAADTGVSYGSMRSIKDFRRISRINDETAFACSGEMADF